MVKRICVLGYTFTADLWSLGVFVFEVVTGKAPFMHKNEDHLIKLVYGGIKSAIEVRSCHVVSILLFVLFL